MICDRSNGDAKPFGDLRIDQFPRHGSRQSPGRPCRASDPLRVGRAKVEPASRATCGRSSASSARFILSYFFSLQNRRGLARKERRVAAARSRQTRIIRRLHPQDRDERENPRSKLRPPGPGYSECRPPAPRPDRLLMTPPRIGDCMRP